MVQPARGAVVTVRFPFSDLSSSKLRPALVLALVGRGDCILCQITSSRYGDPLAQPISTADFKSGSLPRLSYARPGKLFTANQSIIASHIGELSDASTKRILDAVTTLLS
jgi:mRNA interferase MazF